MPSITASAPGKIILFGEHAVVYGQPALAVPVRQVAARAVITAEPRAPSGRVRISSPGIGLESELQRLPDGHPQATAIRLLCNHLGIDHIPACLIRITSTIPVASGLGSGAAVSVALLRAMSNFLGRRLPDEEINTLAYEIEKLHHGTPSGIDNTVITYNLPVIFRRGEAPQTFKIGAPLHLVIGDTGTRAPTAETVGAVRQAWLADPQPSEARFNRIGAIVLQAQAAIESGNPAPLGDLMQANQAELRALGVSSPELETLIEAALHSGAAGAKLSGGGGGGNMIALVQPGQADEIAAALIAAGAKRALQMTLSPDHSHA